MFKSNKIFPDSVNKILKEVFILKEAHTLKLGFWMSSRHIGKVQIKAI